MNYTFPCGCSFPILADAKNPGELPLLDFDIETVPEDCPAVWEMLGRGDTKGVFQLESSLGRHWCKKLRPENLEHLGALGAMLRPGCIAGDTKICISIINSSKKRLFNSKKITIRELYNKFKRDHFLFVPQILSYNEETKVIFNNAIEKVYFNGIKPVFKTKFRTRLSNNDLPEKYYNLICTEDHKLFTLDGWKELRNINTNEKVLIRNRFGCIRHSLPNLNGKYNFRDVCYTNYKYKCVFCDWQEGSLDVNHLDGNRKIDNRPENLCFFCPNHHRLYSENKILKTDVINARDLYKLPKIENFVWGDFIGTEYMGETDVYDITVSGPHHNYIAGNVLVHNCLNAKDENGISMTEHYALRKNNLEDVKSFHPAVDKIFKNTYNVLTYQEQIMALGKELAGFNLVEVDKLRKGVGKKDQKVVSKIVDEFLSGCEKTKVVTAEQAKIVGDWIKAAGRYSFNKSHSVSYGVMGYQTAYIKAHFPIPFFTAWLSNAKNRQDPRQEIYELVNEAKLFDIVVEPPDFRDLQAGFYTTKNIIKFGLCDIKGVGPAQIDRITHAVEIAENKAGKSVKDFSWNEFLIYLGPIAKSKTYDGSGISSSIVLKLIESGALRWLDKSARGRSVMKSEFENWDTLTDKEKLWVQTNIQDKNIPLVEILKLAGVAKKQGGACANKNRVESILSLVNLILNPPTVTVDTPNYIADREDALLGISLTCFKVDSCDSSQVNCSCKDYLSGRKGYLVFGVEIKAIREFKTKRGKTPGATMCYLTVSDGTSVLTDVVCFPNIYEEFNSLITEDNTVIIQGERDSKNDSLIVKKMWQMS